MKKIYLRIKNWLFKPKADINAILEKLVLDNFYGAVGEELYYQDPVEKRPILTIKVTRNNIKIYSTTSRKEYIEKLGIIGLRKKDRVALYQHIEKYLTEKMLHEEAKIKKSLLYGLGLSEAQFAYLVKTCKEY